MIILPIVQRELAAASRRWLTYWLRTGFGLLAIGIGIAVFLATQPAPSFELARALFDSLKWLSLFYCLGYGIRSTADCLSAEKREGTLGLLFLTDLKGHDVVLGKLAACSLGGFYGLLATFPVLALTLLFGGVPAGQFWRVLLVLVTTFFFSLAMGIFVSAISRNARRAMLGTVSWLVLFNVAFPAAGALVRELSAPHSSSLPDLLMLPCPIFTQAQTEAAAGGPSIYFWPSVGCQAALTLVFLAMASWLLPGAWQDRPAEAWRDRWRARWENWAYGDPARRAQWRARWLERNPMSWLSGRNRFQSASVWCLFGVCFVFWELGCLASGAIWYNEGIYFPTVLVLNSVLKFWVALTAGRSLAEDRQSGALELILSTPLSVEGILRGQLLALLRKFLGPIVAVLGIHIIFLAASLQREPFADNPINPTLWIAVMLMLVLDLAALSWVAMWGAMTRKNPNRVTSITLVRVLATPWLLFIALQIVGVLCVDLSPPFPWEVNVGLWFSIGLLVDLGFGFAAWWQLRNGFRQFACSRYVPIPSPFSLASLKRRWWMAG